MGRTTVADAALGRTMRPTAQLTTDSVLNCTLDPPRTANATFRPAARGEHDVRPAAASSRY
jgi:hypothetical protein